jgi:hypothetical protein
MTAAPADPLLTVITLGFVLGLQHATDADHLVAVATIVTRERRFAAGAAVGALWGLGHAATLGLAGGALIALGLTVGPEVDHGLEMLVALMIGALGVMRLRDAFRDRRAAPAPHLLADHEHGGREAFHSHPHDHGAHRHAHPHVHPSRRLVGVLGRERGLALRAVLVGAVHGLAGTAALALLVLATIRSPAAAIVYLAVFGLGTVAGMTLLTAVLAWPVSLALRFRRARRLLALGSGLGAIAFAIAHASGTF